RQRAELTRLAGRADEADRLLRRAEQIPLRSARDHYLLVADQLDEEPLREYAAFLRQACRNEPNNFAWWLKLGMGQGARGQPAEAAASYDHGIALWPEAHWAYFNRGVLYLEQKNHRAARADFDEVLRRRPDIREAHYNRALARFGLGDFAGVVADLTELLEQGGAGPRVYFLRAKAHARLRDLVKAKADLAEGFRLEPRDERDWTARAVARANPQAALPDLERALEFNPRYRPALQDKA